MGGLYLSPNKGGEEASRSNSNPTVEPLVLQSAEDVLLVLQLLHFPILTLWDPPVLLLVPGRWSLRLLQVSGVHHTVYGDEHKQELNPDHRTNPIAMPVLGRLMLNPLRSQCYIDFFSNTRLSIKKFSPWALTSPPLYSGSLMLSKSQKTREERENIALYREGLLCF